MRAKLIPPCLVHRPFRTAHSEGVAFFTATVSSLCLTVPLSVINMSYAVSSYGLVALPGSVLFSLTLAGAASVAVGLLTRWYYGNVMFTSIHPDGPP